MLNFAKRNAFDLTHERKFTCNMGQLVPFLCREVLPGDKWFCKTDLVLRLTPLLAPMMHHVDVFTHFFFVPNRLIWDDFEKFITGGNDGNDNTVWPHMTLSSADVLPGSLADYLGIQCADGSQPTYSTTSVSVLPFRAYAKIFNDWYRDENLQQEVTLNTGNGLDSTTNKSILNRAWKKDYFTNALPWPQKGQSVQLPLGAKAPVYSNSASSVDTSELTTMYGYDTTGSKVVPGGNNHHQLHLDNYGAVSRATATNTTGTSQTKFSLFADLAQATAATVNSVRQAFQLQKWFEINAISGSRYVEQILSMFHVKTGDARLQRSEFIGGGRSPIVISEVVQQSETATTPQGTLTGHGFTASRSHTMSYFFPEHGFLIGIISVMPKPSYQQGLDRMWFRKTRYDYYWPVFSHLGNQEIKNKEIYFQGDGVVDSNGEIVDEKPFGFTGRYDEYRYIPSSVHGDFKTTLNFWHLGRIFNNLPTLNSNFIECNPANRPFAVKNTNVCQCELLNQITAIRPMSKKAYPGLIDHA